ncbi:hypothetical protein HND97_07250 [Vibrio cholerae]|nr:hypothetical protein HND97_07250 [Vibrio cholerae]
MFEPLSSDAEFIGYENKSLSILVVCTGNLCRSPMAEIILRGKIRQQKLNISVSSAGTIK